MRNPISICLLIAFMVTSCCGNGWAQNGEIALPAGRQVLPKPGSMVHLSPAINPSVLKGIKVQANDPFRFEFVLDVGEASGEVKGVSLPDRQAGPLTKPDIKTESTKLIKYFLAALTTPEKDMWVNLSPYEKDRIVPENFGQTQMGRDLLAQDYILKQITASLIYPEDELGKKFWKRVYEQTANKNVAINTFNKVWIVPDKAVVYENAKAGTAYVVESSLKVLTEQDYLACRQAGLANTKNNNEKNNNQIVRDIVIPQLIKEVNEGANFAQLRQVYSSLILAAWYKKKIKDSVLSQVYTDKNKIKGTEYQDTLNAQSIYKRYLEAFKKGAYNYIKEEQDTVTQQIIPRKYFSGGFAVNGFTEEGISYTDQAPTKTPSNHAMISVSLDSPEQQHNQAMLNSFTNAIQAGLSYLPGSIGKTFSRKVKATAILNKMKKGDGLETDELNLLGFGSNQDLANWISREIYQNEELMKKLKTGFDRESPDTFILAGGQSIFYFNQKTPYGMKEIGITRRAVKRDSRLIDKSLRDRIITLTRRSFNLAYTTMGGLVTPFLLSPNFAQDDKIYVRVVKPITNEYLKKKGKRFIDQWLNLIQATWERGNLDTDLALKNLGLDEKENLLISDLGTLKEVNEVDWGNYREALKSLLEILFKDDIGNFPELKEYFRQEFVRRFMDPETDKDFFITALLENGKVNENAIKKLEETVKRFASKKTPAKHVLPFIGGEFDKFIAQLIKEKLSISKASSPDAAMLSGFTQAIQSAIGFLSFRREPRKVELADIEVAKALIFKMRKGQALTSEDLRALNFDSNKVVVEWVTTEVLDNKSLMRKLKRFDHIRESGESGSQTVLKKDDSISKAYALKEIRISDAARTEETILKWTKRTKKSFLLASKRMGGLVTPFLFSSNFMQDGKIYVRLVKPVDFDYVQSQGSRFVDEWLNLLESTWKRGIFDYDMRPNNLGVDAKGNLVILDFGLTLEIKSISPNSKAFLFGVQRLAQMNEYLSSAGWLGELDQYLRDEWVRRFMEGEAYPNFFQETDLEYEQKKKAEVLEGIIRKYEVPQEEGQYVYPLIGGEFNTFIEQLLAQRIAQFSSRTTGNDSATNVKLDKLGGIDFDADKMNLETKTDSRFRGNDNREIKFNIDPAMLERLRKSPGFTPVINYIQPMTDLPAFLGITNPAPVQ